jgi:hypothetical protein
MLRGRGGRRLGGLGRRRLFYRRRRVFNWRFLGIQLGSKENSAFML